MRPARRTAAWKESACRIPTAKKTIASVCGEASYLRVKRKAMNVCGTKPPPKLSSANSAERRATMPRERWSGGRGSSSSSWPSSTAGETRDDARSPVAAASG
jgi:hypothetical protein